MTEIARQWRLLSLILAVLTSKMIGRKCSENIEKGGVVVVVIGGVDVNAIMMSTCIIMITISSHATKSMAHLNIRRDH